MTVGRGTYGLEGCTLSDHRTSRGEWVGCRLTIGRYCSLAPSDFMLGGNHQTGWVSQYPFASMLDEPGRELDGTHNGDIAIGNDVWVAAGALILSGVTIGDGAVVASRAVVTKDVAPYAIVAGVPAKQIGQRFDDATVARLLAMAWWDWSEDEIRARWRELSAPPA